jgi:peptidoglycan/xylan/chitin deacetylase (PgdA/CDA1 family)
MPMPSFRNYYRRHIGRVMFRKLVPISGKRPIISFTFDDFPRSALLAGGKILAERGFAGTYYAALGLMGSEGPSGPLFVAQDLADLLAAGHELGCHTYSHCDSWNTPSRVFEQSVIQNRAALELLIPSAKFRSFSYPLSEPRALSKLRISQYFQCCRAGGQKFNAGTADLARLSAYFLEKSRDNIAAIKDMIDRNRQAHGWLIFATHDVAENPSPYGCTPEFFDEVVSYAGFSGSTILPVAEALKTLNHAEK